MKKILVALFALAITTSSCSNAGRKLTNVSELSQIEGEWSFVSLNGEEVTNPRAYIAFVDGKRVGGSSGCNNFSGAMQFDGSKITIGEMLTTRKMCADMEFEQSLTQALNRSEWKAQFAISYDANLDTLVLTKETEDSVIELVRRLQN